MTIGTVVEFEGFAATVTGIIPESTYKIPNGATVVLNRLRYEIAFHAPNAEYGHTFNAYLEEIESGPAMSARDAATLAADDGERDAAERREFAEACMVGTERDPKRMPDADGSCCGNCLPGECDMCDESINCGGE